MLVGPGLIFDQTVICTHLNALKKKTERERLRQVALEAASPIQAASVGDLRAEGLGLDPVEARVPAHVGSWHYRTEGPRTKDHGDNGSTLQF